MSVLRVDSLDGLTSLERITLRRAAQRDSFVRAALCQVEEIVASDAFVRVQRRTACFLRFVVAKTLIGQADQIKEMSIAIRVYEESADFNPLENSKVRVAGLALRRRLTAYYVSQGHGASVLIEFRLGSFVPKIQVRCLRRLRQSAFAPNPL